jgi:hypothetical protein
VDRALAGETAIMPKVAQSLHRLLGIALELLQGAAAYRQD